MIRKKKDLFTPILSSHSIMRFALCVALLLVFVPTSHALALQPLESFLAGARHASTATREAALVAVQRDAETLAAYGKLMPSAAISGTYTLNQYETVMDNGSGGEIVIQPRNGLSGTVQLTVPLIDLSGWGRAGAAKSFAKAAHLSAQATAIEVDRQVAQFYYQIVGAEALRRSYQTSLAVAEENYSLTCTKRDAGTATDLDVARAAVEVEGAKRNIADQELVAVLARRALNTLTGLVPSEDAPDTAEDLHEELPLATWEERVQGLPSIAVAVEQRRAAEKQASAARFALAPTLFAAGTEQASNTSGFINHSSYFTAMLTLSWNLDVPTFAQIRSQNAAAGVARIQEERANQEALDAVHEAWQRVHTGIIKSRTARSQTESARLAARIARERYATGAASQLELLQAQRDVTVVEAARIQSDADLSLARVLLRLAVGGL